jgi:two-component system cell cycle sensor histidine kinase/response regulator CckA
MAHALNNLMSVVLGHGDMMLNGLKPADPFFASAQAIKRSALRTTTLAQRLLAFGRKQFLNLRSLDLNAVVGGLAEVIRLMQSGVRLDLILEPGLGQTRGPTGGRLRRPS